jgi:hypothetical protein
VSGVTFENLQRDGQLVLNPSQGNIALGAYASPIAFRATAPVTSVDDSARSVHYSGPWRRAHASGLFGQTEHVASSARSSARFTFSGTQARLFGPLSPAGGIATVQVDGGTPVTIDTYQATTAQQEQLFDTGVLAAGRHTLVLRVTGTGDALSSGRSIGLDRIDVVP